MWEKLTYQPSWNILTRQYPLRFVSFSLSFWKPLAQRLVESRFNDVLSSSLLQKWHLHSKASLENSYVYQKRRLSSYLAFVYDPTKLLQHHRSPYRCVTYHSNFLLTIYLHSYIWKRFLKKNWADWSILNYFDHFIWISFFFFQYFHFYFHFAALYAARFWSFSETKLDFRW